MESRQWARLSCGRHHDRNDHRTSNTRLTTRSEHVPVITEANTKENPWGGPWATATITVAGEPEPPPTPEPAEEEPVQHPPKEDPAPEDPAPKDTTPAAGSIDTLAATDDDAGQLVLSWSAPAAPNADPTDYHVNWGKTTEDYPADTAEAGNAHPDSTTHTLVGLEYDTDYNIR